MGIDHTAFAFWGWEIPRDAQPEDLDTETWLEGLCKGIEGLGWLELGAPSYGWADENCPIAISVGGVARQNFRGGGLTNVVEQCGQPDPVTVRRLQGELEQRGVKIQKPIALLLGGSIW